MAGGLYRGSRLAGRLVALIAVVHTVVLAALAAAGLCMDPVAAPHPELALVAALAHVGALVLAFAATTGSDEGSGISLMVMLIDSAAMLACILVASLLWVAGSSAWLTAPCCLLAGLVSALHALCTLAFGASVVEDDITWSESAYLLTVNLNLSWLTDCCAPALRRPAELTKRARAANVLRDKKCCGRETVFGVIQRKADSADLKRLAADQTKAFGENKVAGGFFDRVFGLALPQCAAVCRSVPPEMWWVEGAHLALVYISAFSETCSSSRDELAPSVSERNPVSTK